MAIATNIGPNFEFLAENSFLLSRDCKLYSRREFKIVSAFVSVFTSAYVFYWKEYFPDTTMKYLPSFDGRAVLYPDIKNVRDYFAWRQADCKLSHKCAHRRSYQ
jgi:tRNA(His) guanylyltransferase